MCCQYVILKPGMLVIWVCVQIPKGTTVSKFLELVRMQLVQEFADVRSLGADDLMYIKEDLIIPHVRDRRGLVVTWRGRVDLVMLCLTWLWLDGMPGCSQNYSFYDLIVTKARGKSGPLFHFDVHDDVRVTIDTRIEKDEVRTSPLCLPLLIMSLVRLTCPLTVG